MQFRLVLYKTVAENKYDSEDRFEYLGDREAIWFLWCNLRLNYKHVEVYSLNGIKQEPEKGLLGLTYYSL